MTRIELLFNVKLHDFDINPIKEEDNQNMNSRVQQLYMQLLHEIVKKKDETLETQSLEKKLLNQTVHLYELEVTLWEMKERFESIIRTSRSIFQIIDLGVQLGISKN